MEKFKLEVKTTYTINLTVNDIADAIKDYYKSGKMRKFPRAFEWLSEKEDISTFTNEKIENLAKNSLFVEGNGDTFSYFADYFGFDGFTNSGRWDESKKVYRMVVYDYGNRLN